MESTPPRLTLGPATWSTAIELYGRLKIRVFTLKDVDIESRTVSHWDREKLLGEHFLDEEKSRRFGMEEFVWVMVIKELRDFGVPVPTIRELKAGLMGEIPASEILGALSDDPALQTKLKKEDPETFSQINKLLSRESKPDAELEKISLTPIAMMIAETVLNRVPVSFILFPDLHYWTVVHSPAHPLPKEAQEMMLFSSYIHISISGIIKKFLLTENAELILPQIRILDPKEQKLLEIISSGEYESVTVHFREKEMNRLEIVKSQQVKKQLVDIIAEGKYQDITIKTHEGFITQITNTLKLRFG